MNLPDAPKVIHKYYENFVNKKGNTMDWKTKYIFKLEDLLRECEEQLEDEQLSEKITEMLSRQQ